MTAGHPLSRLILLCAGVSTAAAAAPAPPAALLRRIDLDGFVANEVYPADIDQDGRLELLCLQSAGIFQSKVFDPTTNKTPDEIRNIYCLTAIALDGRMLWRLGTPCLKFPCAKSHVADQMLCCARIAERSPPEIAAIRGRALLILDAATGAIKRSADLGADNFGIVRLVRTRHGNRLLVQNTEKAYPPYAYGLPAAIYDAADLRRIATIGDAVGSGHSPRALDLDGDGDEEILIGFDAYDAQGRRLWRLPGVHRDHVDQLQVLRSDPGAAATVVYAASKDVELGTLSGQLLSKQDFGHPQHVVLGDFRLGDKRACMAVYCCNKLLGAAQRSFLEHSALRADGPGVDNIAFLDHRGQIVSLVCPPGLKNHSGEGILVYPQGAPDGSDVIITRDWGWPQALDMAGRAPFVLPQPAPAPPKTKDYPAGPHTRDGYGIRIADFQNEGRAQVLVHDQTTAWIFQPPYPKKGVPNTHARLRPVSGQGLYGY